MGQTTESRITAWQEASGIEPATGNRLRKLTALSKAAYELIRITELEIAGTRDGDGHWHGSDAMGGAAREIGELWEKPDSDFKDTLSEIPF